MNLQVIPTGPLGVNTSIIINRKTGEAFFIDPGGDTDLLSKILEKEKAKLVGILHTHAHFDHIWGTVNLTEKWQNSSPKMMIALGEEDRFLYENVSMQAANFGFDLDVKLPEINLWYEEGKNIKLAGIELQVLHTPGHSPGSYSFYWEPPASNISKKKENEKTNGIVFTGDALFKGSIGRTDLWKGSLETLLASIQNKLLTLPGNTRIIPGHGPESTIEKEKNENPFLAVNGI